MAHAEVDEVHKSAKAYVHARATHVSAQFMVDLTDVRG